MSNPSQTRANRPGRGWGGLALDAFGSVTVIGISHAAKLAPLLRVPVQRKMLEEAAAVVTADQVLRRSSNAALLTPADVMTKMLTKPKVRAKPVRQAVVTDDLKRTLVSGERAVTGMVTIKLTPMIQRDREKAVEAVKQLLEKLG